MARSLSLACFIIQLGLLQTASGINVGHLQQWTGGVVVTDKHDQYGLKCVIPQDRVITAMVFSSPRPQDSLRLTTDVLKKVLCNLHAALKVSRARTIVAFDGIAPYVEGQTELMSTSAKEGYAEKKQAIKEWNDEHMAGDITIFENPEWTHQALMMKRIFNQLSTDNMLTPWVFVSQDDAIPYDLDMPWLLNMMSCDETVEYVRFLSTDDCDENHEFEQPCKSHSSGRLQQTAKYSDGPHFATTRFYMDHVLPFIEESEHKVPEQCGIPSNDVMWMYGAHLSMKHEVNLFHGAYNTNFANFGRTHDSEDAQPGNSSWLISPESPECKAWNNTLVKPTIL